MMSKQKTKNFEDYTFAEMLKYLESRGIKVDYPAGLLTWYTNDDGTLQLNIDGYITLTDVHNKGCIGK